MVKKQIHRSYWTQGDDVKLIVNINDEASGSLDITGWDFQAQLKEYDTDTLKYQVSVDKTDLGNNNVTFSIPKSETINFESGKYIMDLVYRDVDGAQKAFVAVEVQLSKQRTEWQ